MYSELSYVFSIQGKRMEHGMKTMIFYWIEDKKNYDRIKSAVDSLADIPEVLDLVSGSAAQLGDHIMDETFDIGVVITFAGQDGLSSLLKSPIHDKASAIFKEVCSRTPQGYSFLF